MRRCDHRAPVWIPDWRCGKNCGHRLARGDGTTPVAQTRSLPWQLWPFEVAGRGEAIVRAWLLRTGRMTPAGSSAGGTGSSTRVREV
jgi:hypothetical protein